MEDRRYHTELRNWGINITGVSTMLGETPCKDMSNTCRNDQSIKQKLKAKKFNKHFEKAKEKHIFAQ